MAGEFGAEHITADIEPERGELIGGQVVSDGPNQWRSPAAASRAIEGIVVKALAANAGSIYVQGRGGAQAGFPLAVGESVSIAIDDLVKVGVYIPATGDGFAYLAILDTRD